jgi:hypothetical protein
MIRTCIVLGFLVPATPGAGVGDDPADKPAPARAGGKQDDGKKGARKARFTLGKTTTYVEGPVDPDGRVNYAAALNERLGKGVTPEKNANVLLWKALGPRPQGEPEMPPEFFRLMGMDRPPDEGDYFIDLSRFAKDNPQVVPGREAEAVGERLNRATQRPWTPDEFPDVAAWLKANEKPLTLVVEATKRSHYFSPLVPPESEKGSSGLLNAPLPGVQPCRGLAGALAARAMLRLGRGAAGDAWEDLLACHRLGRLLGRGGCLFEGLVGIAIDLVACRADLAFLDRARPDAKRIDRCLRDLRALPPLPDLAEKVNLGDRFMFLDIVMQVDRRGLQFLKDLSDDRAGQPATFLERIQEGFAQRMLDGIDWDPALETANRWFERAVAVLREPDRPARVRKLDAFSADLKALLEQAPDAEGVAKTMLDGKSTGKARGKAVGDILIPRLMPAINKVQDAADRARQTQDNLTLAFALARYRLDHGRYPERLDALVPRYLPDVPRDLFSGRALVYRRDGDGYVLYSVGVNGRDDGGRGYDDEPPGDDLTVRLPLPDVRRK